MGYYAKYDGSITVECDAASFEKVLKEVNDIFYVCDSSEDTGDSTYTMLLFGNDKYYEDSVRELFEKISDYIIDGEIDFCGEENDFWRLVYDQSAKEWREEPGRIVYESGFEETLDTDLMRRIAEAYEKLRRCNS